MGKLCKAIIKDETVALSETKCEKIVRAYDKAHPKNACDAIPKTEDRFAEKVDCYKEAIRQSKPLAIDTPLTWLLRVYRTWNYGSLGSGEGTVTGGRFALGNSLGNYSTLWGLGIGAERGTSLPHLKELSLNDERTGFSLTLESIERKPFSKSSPWSSAERDARGLGIYSFCPANGSDACWTALSINSTTNWYEIQYQPTGSTWYGALSFDLNTKTYLHLADDQTLRQYSHPSRDIGFFGLSLEIGQSRPTTYVDPKSNITPPSTLSIIHEIFKYVLDDIEIAFSRDDLQSAKKLLNDAGYGSNSDNTPPQVSATTETPTLLLLSKFAGAKGGNAHLQFFDRMDDTQKFAFFWGNVANTALLLGVAANKDSDAWLQGGLSSLLHTGNLIPSWQKMSPETSYWFRFALPHIIGGLGMLPDSDGKQQAAQLTAAEGMLGSALSDSNAIRSKRYSYGESSTTQTYKSGKPLESDRGHFSIEHELESGLGSQFVIASPTAAITNGNIINTGTNMAINSGIAEGQDQPLEGSTLSTTVSCMVGKRFGVRLGDTVTLSAALFGGTLVDLGPNLPTLGITARASTGADIGFKLFNQNLKTGGEVFWSGSKTDHSTINETGVVATLTILK